MRNKSRQKRNERILRLTEHTEGTAVNIIQLISSHQELYAISCDKP